MEDLLFDDDEPNVADWEPAEQHGASAAADIPPARVPKTYALSAIAETFRMPARLSDGGDKSTTTGAPQISQRPHSNTGSPSTRGGHDIETGMPLHDTMGHGPAAYRSLQLMRHARSLSGGPSISTHSNGNSYEEFSSSPTHSRLFGPSSPANQFSASPSKSSPISDSFGLDMHLGRRRSNNQHQSFSSSSPGSSPTFSSFAAMHARRPPSRQGSGGYSPAFGASSPPDLPMHARMDLSSAVGVDEILANISQSPSLVPVDISDPPADADEPWIDLPPLAGEGETPSSPLRKEGWLPDDKSPLLKSPSWSKMELRVSAATPPPESKVNQASPVRHPLSFLDTSHPLTRHRSHSPTGTRSPRSESPTRMSSHKLHRRSPSLGGSSADFPALNWSAKREPTSPLFRATFFNPHEASTSPSQSSPTSRTSTSQSALFPPLPNRDLSLPPRSGWDMSDEIDSQEGQSSPSGSFQIREGVSSLLLAPDLSPSSPHGGTITLPDIDTLEDSKSPEWGAPLDFNRGPAVQIDTLSPEEEAYEPFVEAASDADVMDEEGLTPLERIFLFAKSEVTEHRETVSRLLPAWLQQVEICEAIEYILPLFQSLAEDEDFVKEALANSLDEIMWFFLSSCPIAEMSTEAGSVSHVTEARAEDKPSPTDDGDGRLLAHSIQEDSQTVSSASTGIREVAVEKDRSMGALTAPGGETDGSARAVSPTSEQTLVDVSPHDDSKDGDRGPIIPRPQIRLDTFYQLLATLLMSDVSTITATTQEALVRLLLRLHNKPYPAANPYQQAHLDEVDAYGVVETAQWHKHSDHVLSASNASRIHQDLLENVVLALFAFDTEPHAFASLWTSEKPEQGQTRPPADDFSSKFSSFFDDPMTSASPASQQEAPDPQHAVFVGLTLVALLADTDALSMDVLEHKVLPTVLAATKDGGAMVRRQTVEVFASLCKVLPQNITSRIIAPIVVGWSEDSSVVVRKAIATMLPELAVKIVPEADRKSVILPMALRLGEDLSATVQRAFLEISGPLIYVFEGSVSEELLTVFTGFQAKADTRIGSDRESFQPLVPAFAVSESQAETTTQQDTLGLSWDIAKDYERAIITAYNLPGVCLSLGEAGWHRIRGLHRSLLVDTHSPQVHFLIASSLHDIAKIVGKTAAERDLLDMYAILLEDDEDTAIRALEGYSLLCAALPTQAMDRMLSLLFSTWSGRGTTNWRIRELVAEALSALAEQSFHVSEPATILKMLDAALHDPIAAVRSWAVKAVGSLLRNTAEIPQLQASCYELISALATESHHKFRALFCSCMLNIVDAQLPVQEWLWESLTDLANDAVVGVRLMVARCLAEIMRTTTPSLHGIASRARIQKILTAAMSDSAPCVQDELRHMDKSILTLWVELGGAERSGDFHEAESSDDEDEYSPSTASSRTHTSLNFGSKTDYFRSVSETSDHEHNVPAYKGDEDNDDDSLDLESSTIYELDLDDLATSTVDLADMPSRAVSESTIQPTSHHTSDSAINTKDQRHAEHQSNADRDDTFHRSWQRHINDRALSNTPPCGWNLSMRDEEQYVAIDVTGHA